MSRLLVPIALAMAVWHPAAQTADDPRSVVRTATRAVEGDSSPRLTARWTARARGRTDRAALLGLATLARLRYDYPAAESTYRGLLSGPRDSYAVYARLGLGDGYESRSFGRDAARELTLALAAAREARDQVAESEALLRLAFVRGRLEGVRVAEALLDTATRLIPDTAFDLRSRLTNRRAIVLALHGRTDAASAVADSSVTFARRALDPRAEADAFRVTGQVLQYRQQWDSALVALQRSEELYRRARSRSALASSLIWHAQVLSNRMRYGEAREVARRAIEEGEATHNPAAIGDGHRALGALAQILGDWPTAAAHLKRALAISEETGDSSGVRTTSKFLAEVALAAGDVATARRLTFALIAWARGANDPKALFEGHRTFANIAAREGDTAAVTRSLEAARSQLAQLPGENFPVLLLHDEARHALTRGDLAAAERSLMAYLRLAKPGTCDICRFDARLRLADVHARRGQLDSAEAELVGATDEIDSYRARLGDAELRTLAFQSAITTDAAAAEPGASSARLARVVGVLAAGGRVDVAFGVAERWRARELMDQMSRAAAMRAGKAGSVSASALSREKPRSAAAIASALPDEHTALVEYVAAAGGPTTAFIVQRSGVRARVLPSLDSLAESVVRFASLLESGTAAARLARDLGAAFAEPVFSMLDARVTRVIVVPDGVLHRLPFDALRLASGQYAAQRYALGIAPSASVVATLWARPRNAAPASALRLLALGDPPVVPRLPGAAREARLVARYAPVGEVRVGRDASAAFLKHAALRPYRVLHFATHAVVDERSISGTALALAAAEGDDGLVGVGELAALDLDADLVVLSACRSAGGVLVGGEGVQGLTSPLLQAGARSLVATGWLIRDADAVPFVDGFYGALARGLPVVDALHDAKLAAIQRGEPPRVWAAFLAIGDPLVTVPLRAPPTHWWSAMFDARR
ncbi:MAG TPA: CHAT domain-containing tetratricopeptide repeat protein [Gemmatimonadaceae bacterium]|nr:CHAT domain-containing tetratricopeptide repeat protein [Gemmatimonadaceae bacterium]